MCMPRSAHIAMFLCKAEISCESLGIHTDCREARSDGVSFQKRQKAALTSLKGRKDIGPPAVLLRGMTWRSAGFSASNECNVTCKKLFVAYNTVNDRRGSQLSLRSFERNRNVNALTHRPLIDLLYPCKQNSDVLSAHSLARGVEVLRSR